MRGKWPPMQIKSSLLLPLIDYRLNWNYIFSTSDFQDHLAGNLKNIEFPMLEVKPRKNYWIQLPPPPISRLFWELHNIAYSKKFSGIHFIVSFCDFSAAKFEEIILICFIKHLPSVWVTPKGRVEQVWRYLVFAVIPRDPVMNWSLYHKRFRFSSHCYPLRIINWM